MTLPTRVGLLVTLVILVTVQPLLAETAVDNRERKWGLGWQEGLTLRRAMGPWQVGVSAGPDDWLRDIETRSWNDEEPDSLQGRLSDLDEDRRESGYVRLQVARRLVVEAPLAFMVETSLRYRWSDVRNRDEYWVPKYGYEGSTTSDYFTKEWTLGLALRLAWRPLAMLTIETDFGLVYSWEETERAYESIRVDYEDPEDSYHHVDGSYTKSHSFGDTGWRGLVSLDFIVWF